MVFGANTYREFVELLGSSAGQDPYRSPTLKAGVAGCRRSRRKWPLVT
jgi:hypothetical protein